MRLLALIPLAALAACSIEKNDGKEEVNINASDNGAVAFSVPGVSGKIKLPAAMAGHGYMDMDGVRMFPGSKIRNVRVVDHDVTIGFAAPGKPEAVRAYYAKAFADAGMNAKASADGFDGKTKDGDAFHLALAEASDGATAATMTIHDKD